MNATPDYLTTAEAAAFLRVAPKTLRNKVAAGVFREGEHFFRPRGLGPRWKRSALIAWLEGSAAVSDAIPMARASRYRAVAEAADRSV